MIKPPRIPDLTILLAEASEYQRRIVREALRSTGTHKVFDAAEAESALQSASKLVPDVMILDADLPGIDCLEVLRRLADDPDTTCPVILTVARPTIQFVASAMSIGQRDILAKPIRPSDLWRRIGRLIDSGRIRPGHVGGADAGRAALARS